MKKEMLIKLLILCGVSNSTIRYCTYLHVTVGEVNEYRYHILAEQNGRMEI